MVGSVRSQVKSWIGCESKAEKPVRAAESPTNWVDVGVPSCPNCSSVHGRAAGRSAPTLLALSRSSAVMNFDPLKVSLMRAGA